MHCVFPNPLNLLRQARRAVIAMTVSGFVIAAHAQAPAPLASLWPTKPIRMVIAFPPGGPTDIVSRTFAQKLSEALGQQVIVDNKPGAGGNIAAELVAKAAPDGYTLFYNTSAVAIAPALYGKVGYDVLKDFAPVALTATIPLVLIAHPGVPAKSVKELIDLAKAKPGQLNYGSSGNGTISHLVTALFSAQLGLQTQHVPYKGSAPALLDLAAGQIQFMFDTMNTALPFVKDGRMRAIAVTSLKRSSLLPDTPTLAEGAMPGFETSAWQGVLVPAGTPADIIARLNVTLNQVLQQPDVRARLAGQGAEPLGGTAADYAAYLRAELPRWAKVVKESGATAQ